MKGEGPCTIEMPKFAQRSISLRMLRTLNAQRSTLNIQLDSKLSVASWTLNVRNFKCFWLVVALIYTVVFLALPASAAEKKIIRVGHFPNISHAQAVVAHGLSRENKGWFEQRLGADTTVQWFVYNAGPSAMEALLVGSIDLAYVGPNPAINAHLRSKATEVRIVAGACSGGAALVVQADGRIKADGDFKGKKIGSPQFGNTQDVAARSWLKSKGFRVTLTGGDVQVIPTANPDQLLLFAKGNLDGVWTVEPWVSRLVLEGKGRVYLDESALWPETKGKYVTTHLVSSVRFLQQKPELMRKWIGAHVELTDWINKNTAEAKTAFNRELKAETTRPLALEILDRAWGRLELTWDPVSASLRKAADDAYRVGLLKEKPELSKIYALNALNQVLREKHLPEVR